MTTISPKTPLARQSRISHLCYQTQVQPMQQYRMTVPSLAASRPALGHDVRQFFQHVQPMNLDILLDKYFPGLNDAPPPSFDITSDDFKLVNAAPSEPSMYAPLRDVLDKVLTAMGGEGDPQLGFQVTNNTTQQRARIADELLSLVPDVVPDVAAYRPSLLQDPKSISWPTIDLAIEVKKNLSADPIVEFDSDEPPESNRVQSMTRDRSMSQITDYARCMTYVNSRHRVFVLGIFAKTARIFVYDHAAPAFSEAFDYNQHPELLGRFLRRFSIANDASRGFDPTVTESLSDAERSRVDKAIDTWNQLRTRVKSDHGVDIQEIYGAPCRIVVRKGDDEVIFLTLGGPIFSSIGLFSRGTRCWLAFDALVDLECDGSNAVLIKDSWVQAGRIPEHEYYEQIQRSGECDGIAKFMYSADFDVEVHCTMNHEAAGVVARHHMRSVLGTVGRRLSQFKSTKELTQGILSAVQGHRNVLQSGVLHRDISAHNVLLPLIPGLGSGFIIDLDLSLFTDSKKRRHVEGWHLTGTIQFMAIARLDDRTIEHQTWHDLESFFWVLLYTVLRHTRNSWNEDDEGKETIIALFDSPRMTLIRQRRDFLERPRDLVIHENKPLTVCIHLLARLLSGAYPSDKAQEDGQAPQYPTHKEFSNILSTQLRETAWPDDPPIPWERPTSIEGVIQPMSSRAISLRTPFFVGSRGSGTGEGNKSRGGSQGGNKPRKRKADEPESSQATSSKKSRTSGV